MIFYILAVVLILMLFPAVAVVVIYNKIIQYKNQTDNAYSQIYIQLKRRYDLIPKLVEAVKGYLQHEKETLENVIKARNQAAASGNIKEQAESNNFLTGALKSLFAVMENYPELKANQNVMQLQEEIISTENKISFSRQHYNDSVMEFNNHIQMFPSNIVAGFFRFAAKDFYVIEDIEHSKDVKIKF